MSYNIERGFHNSEHIFQEHRLQAALRIVREVNPDILALTEACYGAPNSHGIAMNYQELFQFPHGHFGGYTVNDGARPGDEYGNCLLSKLSLEAETIALAYKGAVRGRINIRDRILNLDVVHPSYSVDDLEKISTLRPLITTRKNPYLLTGDLNTVHPHDNYDWDVVVQDLKYFNPQKAEWIVENWRKAELVSWLLGQGLQDAFPLKARQSTVPTGKNSKGVRMDFAFHSPDLRVLEAYVLKNEDTEIASDHYPIVVKFEI